MKGGMEFMGATREEVEVLAMEEGSCLDLPPGFRFHPTDEEIVTSYLLEKAKNKNFSARAMGEVDLNRCEPWDLPSKAKMGEKEWYFFCQRDRKYPTGMRTNRATESGYWKATGKDKEIFRGKSFLVGMKKTLVFYKGRAPKGEKTNWVMHEYRLDGKSLHCDLPRAAKDTWVVCRVFHKSAVGVKKSPLPETVRSDSFVAVVKPPFEEDYLLDSCSFQSLLESPYHVSSDRGDFKPAPPSSNPSYFPTGVGVEDLHNSFLVNNSYLNTSPQVNLYDVNPPKGPMFQYPQACFPSPSHSLPSPPNMGFLHQKGGMNPGFLPLHGHATAPGARAFAPQEQVSNQTSTLVSASPDTAMSADRNTETSSVVVSNHGVGVGSRSYDDVVDCPSDIETLWKY